MIFSHISNLKVLLIDSQMLDRIKQELAVENVVLVSECINSRVLFMQEK